MWLCVDDAKQTLFRELSRTPKSKIVQISSLVVGPERSTENRSFGNSNGNLRISSKFCKFQDGTLVQHRRDFYILVLQHYLASLGKSNSDCVSLQFLKKKMYYSQDRLNIYYTAKSKTKDMNKKKTYSTILMPHFCKTLGLGSLIGGWIKTCPVKRIFHIKCTLQM